MGVPFLGWSAQGRHSRGSSNGLRGVSVQRGTRREGNEIQIQSERASEREREREREALRERERDASERREDRRGSGSVWEGGVKGEKQTCWVGDEDSQVA